jgi:hypothetical protein
MDKLHEAQDGMRRTLYFARSNLLQNAWDANKMGQVYQVLDQQRPGPGERDLRGFEWYYRDRQSHQDLLTIANLGGDRPAPIYPAFSPDGESVVAQAAQTEGKLYLNEIAIYDLANCWASRNQTHGEGRSHQRDRALAAENTRA